MNGNYNKHIRGGGGGGGGGGGYRLQVVTTKREKKEKKNYMTGYIFTKQSIHSWLQSFYLNVAKWNLG